MRFHEATCRLIGLLPAVDEAAAAAISNLNRQLGVIIPAAVAEWYTLRGAQEVVAGASDDEVVGLEQLGEPLGSRGPGAQWHPSHSNREPGCVSIIGSGATTSG